MHMYNHLTTMALLAVGVSALPLAAGMFSLIDMEGLQVPSQMILTET